LQASENKPVSKSSSYSSLSSVDKQSVVDSVPLEDKLPPTDNKIVLSPALSKTSVASSNKSANLEAKSAETITVFKNENENKDEKSPSTSNNLSRTSSISKISISSHHLSNADQTNVEHIVKQTNSMVTDLHPDASSETSKPSLMVNTLDKQMAELQEALCAAGLPPIGSNTTVDVVPVNAESEPIARSPSDLPEDIEQVLRELATQEVVSLSRKILHEKQTEMENIQTVSQHLQTAHNHEVTTPLHEKLGKDIHSYTFIKYCFK